MAHDETDSARDTTGAAGGLDADAEAALAELRGIRLSIDNIDAALVNLLAERFKFTQSVGRLKAAHGLPASDPERERAQIARLRALAEDAQLDPAFAEKWFNFVVAEVIHHHERFATGSVATNTSSTS
ncbi:MAG TPA: chorismate mutase [Pseudolysinimonas sp.]|nr:chorismate mutase [Pseudolysinimonas sp.]